MISNMDANTRLKFGVSCILEITGHPLLKLKAYFIPSEIIWFQLLPSGLELACSQQTYCRPRKPRPRLLIAMNLKLVYSGYYEEYLIPYQTR